MLQSDVKSIGETSVLARRIATSMCTEHEKERQKLESLASSLGVQVQDEDETKMLADMVVKLAARAKSLEALLDDTVAEVQLLRDRLDAVAPEMSSDDILVIRRKLDQDLATNAASPSSLVALYNRDWFLTKAEKHRVVVAYSLINYFEARGYKVPDLWEMIATTNGAMGA